MEKIRDDRDLRIAYEMLGYYKEFAYDEIKPDKVNRLKRQIREYTHKETNRRIVRNDGIDGYVLLIQCPDWIETERDADEWFMEEEDIQYKWSDHDCTGQIFTTWYKCKKRNGKWICYHCVSVDV